MIEKTDRRFAVQAALLGAAVALCFTFINISWYSRAPEGWQHTGMLQSDLIWYSAIAREVVERGNGIGYINPHSFDDTPNPWLFQWPLTLVGWIWGATKMPWGVLWDGWRIVWSAAMFGSIGLLVSALFPAGRLRWFTLLVIAFGGGIAWLLALPPGTGHYLDRFVAVEGEYHWWFFSVFRNVLYPLETTYHTLVFLSMWALVTRRFRLFVGVFLAGAFSSPFAGVQLFAMTMPWILLEWLLARRRDSKEGGTGVSPAHVKSREAATWRGLFAYCTVVAAIFFVYYFLIVNTLASDGPEMFDVYADNPFKAFLARVYPIALAPLIIPAILAIVARSPRMILVGTPGGRMVLCGVLFVWLLMNNHWFYRPGHGVQPPHFCRGYLYAMIGLAAAYSWHHALPGRLSEWLEKNRIAGILAQAAIIVLVAMDSIIFTVKVTVTEPHLNHLMLTDETVEIIDYFNEIPESVRILNCWDGVLGNLLAANTPHVPVFGGTGTTPAYIERQLAAQEWLLSNGQGGYAEELGIQYHILPTPELRLQGPPPAMITGYTVTFQNDRYTVMKRVQPGE